MLCNCPPLCSNKSLILKAFLLFTCASIIAGEALAFGGIGIGSGGGHKSSTYKGGVDAIGIHINGKGKANIDIRTCDSATEELVGTECLPKCADGLERNTDNSCTICKNKNVYLSYMDDPCETETPMNQIPCSEGDDGCCIASSNFCRAHMEESSGNNICPTETAKSCTSNKDCESGEFCNLMSAYWECDKPDTGTCMLANAYLDVEINGLGKVRASEHVMTWWAAENWCKAHKMSLIDISAFNCYEQGTENLVVAGTDYNGSCCANGQECDGDYPEDLYDDNIDWSHYSSITLALRRQFPEMSFWTASQNSGDTCAVYGIDIEAYGDRRDNFGNGLHALCK